MLPDYSVNHVPGLYLVLRHCSGMITAIVA